MDELLIRLRNPHERERAFSDMVKKYQQSVYYFVRRMVVDHDDANDVAQNVFIKAWKGLDGFRGDAQLSTWLYRIAHNESVSFIQREQRIAGISLDRIAHELPSTLRADKHYSGDEIQMKLQTAIALLPEKQKAVFIMKYYDDKTYDEMSAITGTSVGALKASYHHAVKKIEQFLRGEE
ncbi:MAG: sigma-70 family RNA polymerase sigma factor [Flavobacteriales bacterium]|nr:sigma-70 family RNA polymerase sigma factor [Flavobacteriales bacterium]